MSCMGENAQRPRSVSCLLWAMAIVAPACESSVAESDGLTGDSQPAVFTDATPGWSFIDGVLTEPSGERSVTGRPTRMLTGNLGPTASRLGTTVVFAERSDDVQPADDAPPLVCFEVRIVEDDQEYSIPDAYGSALRSDGAIAYAAFAAGDGYRDSSRVAADLFVRNEGETAKWSATSGRWIPAAWVEGVLLAYLVGEGESLELHAFTGPAHSVVVPGRYVASSSPDSSIVFLSRPDQTRLLAFDIATMDVVDVLEYERSVPLSYVGAFDPQGRLYVANDTALFSVEIDEDAHFVADTETWFDFGVGNFIGGIEPNRDGQVSVLVEEGGVVANVHHCQASSCEPQGISGEVISTTLVRVIR